MNTSINPDVIRLPQRAIRRAARLFPTPFFIYDERQIRANCRAFDGAFRRYFPSFSPLYALKANTNPHLVKIVFSEGFNADASSEAEAWLARKLGATGMYTGNYTTEQEFRYVVRLGKLELNLDDITMLTTIRNIAVPEFISFRVNPGFSRGGMKSLFLAGPDAKFGVPLGDVVSAYKLAREMGVKRFGIHAMTGSNVLDESYFAEVAARLLDVASKLRNDAGIEIEKLNIGGGFGVPYRPDERSLDINAAARGVRRAFDDRCSAHRLREPILMAEPGRYIMANAGWLIGRVHVIKKSRKTFVGIDAGMNDLPRPAIYGAYHHISVLGKTLGKGNRKVNVVGRLCENNDQFARDRMLPPVRVGDILAIHTAGAHSFAMGHNYNNRLRSAEYLITLDGTLRKIRRAETIRDLFRTSEPL